MKVQIRFTLSACLPCDVSSDDIVETAEYVRCLQQTISQALDTEVKIEACTVDVKENT